MKPPTKPPFLYRRFNLFRPGPEGVPELVGGFIVGVSQRTFQNFQKDHPSADMDSIFRAMILPREWAVVGRYLKTSLEPMPVVELSPYEQDPEDTRGRATFEGVDGKKFWIDPRRRNPGFC